VIERFGERALVVLAALVADRRAPASSAISASIKRAVVDLVRLDRAPGSTSSSPMVTIATFGHGRVGTVTMPTAASTASVPESSRVPARATLALAPFFAARAHFSPRCTSAAPNEAAVVGGRFLAEHRVGAEGQGGAGVDAHRFAARVLAPGGRLAGVQLSDIFNFRGSFAFAPVVSRDSSA